MKKNMKNIYIYLIIITVLVAVDQLTKFFVFKNLGNGAHVTCIPNIIDFNTLYNDGAIFGILSGKKWLFIIVTFIGMCLFGYMLKDGDIKLHPFYTIGLLLTMAGALGNFIDRIFIGEVRDFIDFAFMRFASFNFADMCMCVGVVMIIIDLLWGDISKKWN